MAEAVLMYRSFMDAVEKLPTEYQLDALKAIIRYGLDGTEPDDGIASAMLAMAKPVIDKNEKRRESGRKGGESEKQSEAETANGEADAKQTEATAKQTEANMKQTEANAKQTEANGSKPEADKNQEQETSKQETSKQETSKQETSKGFKKTVRFAPPSVEEVAAYIAEKGYHFDAEQFVAFYASKGWKVGTQPMKDWKAACITWEKRRTERQTDRAQPKGRNARPAEQHDYNWDDIDAMLMEAQRKGGRE